MKTLFTLLLASTTFAAIPPSTLTPQDLHFTLGVPKLGWEISPAPTDAQNIKLLYRGPVRSKTNEQPTLTVRIEKLNSEEKNVTDYLNHWLKEYPKFGYSVLGHKPFKLDGKLAYVVDVVSSTNDKQARQVITENNGEVALLTCMDSRAEFSATLDACNSIVRTMKWK